MFQLQRCIFLPFKELSAVSRRPQPGFISPVLLIMRWATPKETAAVSAAFILLSSAAGLIGLTLQFSRPPVLISEILFFVPAVLIGGWFGAYFGAAKLTGLLFRRILALVPIAAAFKLGTDAII